MTDRCHRALTLLWWRGGGSARGGGFKDNLTVGNELYFLFSIHRAIVQTKEAENEDKNHYVTPCPPTYEDTWCLL